MKIKKKIMGIVLIVLVLVALPTLLAAFFSTYSSMSSTFEQNVQTNATLCYKLIDNTDPGNWSVVEKNLFKGSRKMNNYSGMLDWFSKQTGCQASIYQGDTIVSTNVKNEKGEKVMGEKASAEVKDAVLTKGNTYMTSTTVNGTPYRASYTPLLDQNKKVVGIFYLGVNESDITSSIIAIVLPLLIVIIVCFAVGILLALLFSAKLVKRINSVKMQLTAISDKDLTVQIPDMYLKGKDEVADMARAAAATQTELRQVIHTIEEETQVIDEAIDETGARVTRLSDKLGNMSATTEQVSAGLEETAVSMEQLDTTSDRIEEAMQEVAQKASEGAKQVVEITNRALELKQNAQKSQSDANAVLTTSRDKMQQAIADSRNIQQIQMLTDTIKDITDQTNLLAMNASIEAARAGDAGKGFAVVASEITNLSDASAEAVKKIQKVAKTVTVSVNNLTESAQTVMDFIDNSVIAAYANLVDTGEQYHKDAAYVDGLVNSLSSTSEEVLKSLNNMNEIIDEISRATNEGANGSSTIAEDTTTIASNSVDINELSNATGISSSKLREFVAEFKLGIMGVKEQAAEIMEEEANTEPEAESTSEPEQVAEEE